jgi:hypothetical protein
MWLGRNTRSIAVRLKSLPKHFSVDQQFCRDLRADGGFEFSVLDQCMESADWIQCLG